MKKNLRSGASGLVRIIRDLIKETTNSMDTTQFCYVESVNENGTANVRLVSDDTTIIPNIKNQTPYDLNVGDRVVLYLIRNRLNNAFIIAKF